MSARSDIKRERLEFHVKQYVPDAEGESLDQRVTLLQARDWCAHLRGRVHSPFSGNLAAEAQDIAGQYVFNAKCPAHELKAAAELCRRLSAAALAADTLAAIIDE